MYTFDIPKWRSSWHTKNVVMTCDTDFFLPAFFDVELPSASVNRQWNFLIWAGERKRRRMLSLLL